MGGSTRFAKVGGGSHGFAWVLTIGMDLEVWDGATTTVIDSFSFLLVAGF